MSLDSRPPYPHQRCYVLKLHRDADPAAGELRGNLEHVATGTSFVFDSAATLQRVLLGHASGVQTDAGATPRARDD